MKTKYALKWITAVLTAVLLTCFGITALAYERIDIDQEASLTLQFNRDSTGFSVPAVPGGGCVRQRPLCPVW